MLSVVKKVPELGVRSARQLHLFPKTDTDLPMVVHLFQQGQSDLVHDVRTKSYDIHGSVAKGSMSSVGCACRPVAGTDTLQLLKREDQTYSKQTTDLRHPTSRWSRACVLCA